jgi:hypothetical protein
MMELLRVFLVSVLLEWRLSTVCLPTAAVTPEAALCAPPLQGQGVLSDRLRSFSMQDLSSCQADPDSVDGEHESASQHRARSMMRSKSESYSKGGEKCLSTDQ